MLIEKKRLVIYDEISSRAYADVLLRLASSEGLYEEHVCYRVSVIIFIPRGCQDILYVSSPLDEDDLMEKLPSRSVERSSESKKAAPPDESMQASSFRTSQSIHVLRLLGGMLQ